MMYRFVSIACMFVFLAAASGAAEIGEIAVRSSGPGKIDESFVRTRISTKVGSQFSKDSLARDVKALLDSGAFTTVDFGTEDIDGGKVRVIISVVSKLRLDRPVEVKGGKYLSEARVRDLLDLRAGDLVDDNVLGFRAMSVVQEYRKKYYPDVEVSWKIDTVDAVNGLAAASLTISEGRRARVKGVTISGNKAVADSELRKALKQPSRWNPLWWFRKKHYMPDELEQARLEMRDMYLNRGYLDAKVALPEIRGYGGSSLTVDVQVHEGVAYKVSKTSISGISLFGEAGLEKLIRLRVGDVAAADAIGASAQAIRDYYGQRGYINTSVRPAYTANEASGTVDVRFEVVEGALTHIRNIVIQGNSRTKDKVIRRELLVFPGDIYDEVKIRRSERIVSNLGYFQNVRSFPVSTSDPDEKDLNLQLEEQRTGNIAVGMGFSSVDDLMGYLDLTQGNFDLFGWPYFTGGGQKLKLHIQAGSERRDYSLTFIEPWFLDRKLSFSMDLYRRESDYSSYDVKRTGVGVGLGRALPWANRLDLRYRLERAELGDIGDDNEYFYVEPPHDSYYFSDEPENTTESTFTISVTHDTRDNPFVPTRGLRSSVFSSITGGPLGFDVDMYGVGATVSQYVPLWWKHVLNLRTRVETMDSYGDTDDIPLDDRLFVGGGKTIRGFRYRDVGPKVQRTESGAEGDTIIHKAVGGRSLAIATAEYSIPVLPKVRLAAFFDIGNAWRDSYDFSLDNLASSYGGGLRLDIPGFPIRIDYAVPIDKDNELTRKDEWIFWIGYDY